MFTHTYKQSITQENKTKKFDVGAYLSAKDSSDWCKKFKILVPDLEFKLFISNAQPGYNFITFEVAVIHKDIEIDCFRDGVGFNENVGLFILNEQGISLETKCSMQKDNKIFYLSKNASIFKFIIAGLEAQTSVELDNILEKKFQRLKTILNDILSKGIRCGYQPCDFIPWTDTKDELFKQMKNSATILGEKFYCDESYFSPKLR